MLAVSLVIVGALIGFAYSYKYIMERKKRGFSVYTWDPLGKNMTIGAIVGLLIYAIMYTLQKNKSTVPMSYGKYRMRYNMGDCGCAM
jgi:hypothetical protein